MKYERQINYNENSSNQYGWEPYWFGAIDFNEDLIEKIMSWQKDNGLQPDGMVGPTTFRRIWTERESNISDHITFCPKEKDNSYIICNGDPVEIEWPKVVLWDEKEGFKARKGAYTDCSGSPERKPTMFVNHWDVFLSSESCARVLNQRGISVHFLIDNDGTIYQMLDTQHKAWHAGSINGKSIGVEIANAYYPKYQNWYEKNGFGKRPIVSGAICNGSKMEDFLDFYPVQIEALKALWVACNKAYDIPLEAPESGRSDFLTSRKTEASVKNGSFKGYVSHYHQSNRKIDCANLDIVKLLKEIKN